MRFDIVKTLYASATVIDESGNIVHSHSNHPFKDIRIETTEQLESFLHTYYSVTSTPIFDTITVDTDTYWVYRKYQDGYTYYLIKKCKHWDAILEKAKSQSTIDGLTGCFTKTETESLMDNLLLTFLRYKTSPFSVIMFDIDFFKKVNDSYGHLAGDHILKELSILVKTHIRASDIFGRFGGEEFILLLPQTKVNGALQLANKLKESCQNHNFIFDGTKIKITISLGVTSISITDSLISLIDRCDKALYDAKQNGRNRVEYR